VVAGVERARIDRSAVGRYDSVVRTRAAGRIRRGIRRGAGGCPGIGDGPGVRGRGREITVGQLEVGVVICLRLGEHRGYVVGGAVGLVYDQVGDAVRTVGAVGSDAVAVKAHDHVVAALDECGS